MRFGFVHDPRWHEVDLDCDPVDWAREALRLAWRRGGRKAPREVVDGQAAVVAGVVAELRTRQALAAAFILCPEPWNGIAALVTVTVDPMPLAFDLCTLIESDAGDAGDDGAAGLRVLEVEQSTLDTPGGQATRMRSRAALGPIGRMLERLVYVWPLPDQRAVVSAVALFDDLTLAGRWAPVVDNLARGFALVDAGSQLGAG